MTPQASANASKYRPDSLLPAVGKTSRRFLLHRLEKFVEANKALQNSNLVSEEAIRRHNKF
jgi:hypothetical protein